MGTVEIVSDFRFLGLHLDNELGNQHHWADQNGTARISFPKRPKKQCSGEKCTPECHQQGTWGQCLQNTVFRETVQVPLPQKSSQNPEGHIPLSASNVPTVTLRVAVQHNKGQNKQTEKQHISQGCSNNKCTVKHMHLSTHSCNIPHYAINCLELQCNFILMIKSYDESLVICIH